MAYECRIEGTDADKVAVRFAHSGRHDYLHITLETGSTATLRVGYEGVRLTVYPSGNMGDRASREFTFAQAGAATTWVANERELGDGHWLHTFQLPALVAWARQAGIDALTDLGEGRLLTENMITEPYEYKSDRLYSTAEVAAELGITPRRVQVLSQHRQVGRQVGRAFVFTAQDIDAMRERVPGRPAQTT